MPDITMCLNAACPYREQCYRYTATPDPIRQSYAAFEFNNPAIGSNCCDYFEPLYSTTSGAE